MTQKIINLNSRTFVLAYDFATLCEVEAQTDGQPNIGDTSVSNLTLIIWCALKTHNDDVPSLQDFRKNLSLAEFKACNDILAPLIKEFYDIPTVAETHVPESKGESDPKND